MKLIKVADSIESRLDPDQIEEYRMIKSRHKILSEQFVQHLDKSRHDPGDIRWVNRFEEIKRELKEVDQRLSEIKAPAMEKLNRDRELYRRKIEEEKKRTEDIYDRAKNDDSFQIQIENAVQDWPRTDNPKLAGYIMQDGSMLNFSYNGYQRDYDHRDITQDIDDLDGGTDGMIQFQLATGAVRLHAQGNGYVSFDWEVEPTRSQKRKMVEIAEDSSEIYIRAFEEEKNYDDVLEMQEDLGWY